LKGWSLDKRKRYLVALALGAAVSLVGGAIAWAQPAQVSRSFTLPVRADVDATSVQCDNTGSTVEISGSLTLGGVAVRLTFKNNVQGTHQVTTTGTASVEVTPANGGISLPKQPVFGGVGGNPWLSFQFTDSAGKALSNRILLGRCVQGLALNHVSQNLGLTANAGALAQALDCSNRGSTISLGTSQTRGALNGVLYMDNNKNKVVHEETTAARLSVSLTTAQTIQKQGSVGGPGGNPLISLQFLGQNGPIGSEVDLGRCVKLG
jgi:hypothetical protein